MTAVRVVPRRPIVVPLTTRKIRLRVLPGTAAVAASADAAKSAATQAAASAQAAKDYVDLVNMSELSIGSVTDGPTADATITGSAPNQTLNLVLPQSQVPGPPGPPNELTIGTVTEGPADASIAGDAPNQTLNLTIPKGNTGNAATIAIGTVTTVDPGDPATVTNSGTSSAAVFDFEIPQGDDGADGKSFVWKGAYSGATAYVADDVVRDQGSSWIALQATTGNAPPSLPTTSNAYWELAAEKGADGSGSGDVTAASNIADGAIVVGDGGGKGVKAHASGAPGTAAFADTSDFATAAQGGLADTAVQPGDLGTMAAEDAGDYTKTSDLGDAAFKDTGTGSGDVAAGNHGHGDATTSVPGFMSASDKTKLDGIASNATANTGTVTSVAMSVPTGLSVSGSPVTTSGTFTVTWASGYEGFTTTLKNKLDGIEANADVTDATNVAAAGAAMLATENQALTGGATVTSKSLGTLTTGTLTLDMGDRPLQHYTNNGAHTLAPGSINGSCLVDITNGASAGAITTSGWTKVAGDSFTTTNAHKFRCHCSVGNGGSLLIVQALQ